MEDFLSVKFGNVNIIVDKQTKFFNASKLCKDYDRNYSEWSNKDRTKKLFKNLKSSKNNISMEFNPLDQSAIDSKTVVGVYLCKDFLLDLLSWLSPEFYLYSNNLIISDLETINEIKFDRNILSNLEQDAAERINSNIENVLSKLEKIDATISKQSSSKTVAENNEQKYYLFRNKYWFSFGRNK